MSTYLYIYLFTYLSIYLFIYCGRHFVICFLNESNEYTMPSYRKIWCLILEKLVARRECNVFQILFDRHMGRKKLPTRLKDADADAERLTLP